MTGGDDEARSAERAWIESRDPADFIRWRAIRARQGEAWSPVLGQRVAAVGGAEGIVVRVTRRRVRIRDDRGRCSVAPIERVAPVSDRPTIAVRRVSCAGCGVSFWLAASAGTMRPVGRSLRWTCDVAPPFHLHMRPRPERLAPCPGSEQFAIPAEVWSPRAHYPSRLALRLAFHDDVSTLRARARNERLAPR